MTRALGSCLAPAAALALALAAPPLSAQRQPARGSPELLAALAAKPTPRLADRPDLNGTWDHLGGIEFVRPVTLPDGSVCVAGCTPPDGRAGGAGRAGGSRPAAAGWVPKGSTLTNFPPYRPELRAKVQDLHDRQVETDTVLQCQAPGVPRIGPPHKIVQTAREVVFLYDDVSGGFFRIVPIDGRPHRAGVPRSYLGDAVGRFEGDTLVVETVNFNAETWLTDDGAFHTADLRVVERLRRVGDTIEYEAIAYDPAVLTGPWTARRQTIWLTDRELEEPVRCEDRDLPHIVDGSHHDNPR